MATSPTLAAAYLPLFQVWALTLLYDAKYNTDLENAGYHRQKKGQENKRITMVMASDSHLQKQTYIVRAIQHVPRKPSFTHLFPS